MEHNCECEMGAWAGSLCDFCITEMMTDGYTPQDGWFTDEQADRLAKAVG